LLVAPRDAEPTVRAGATGTIRARLGHLRTWMPPHVAWCTVLSPGPPVLAMEATTGNLVVTTKPTSRFQIKVYVDSPVHAAGFGASTHMPGRTRDPSACCNRAAKRICLAQELPLPRGAGYYHA